MVLSRLLLVASSFESPTPPPLLKEQYEPFSLFLEETSICLRKHNGIIILIINYNSKSLNLHLHHLSQVRARSPSGAHAVHVWLARCARLACSLCASGLPMCARGARLARPWCGQGSLLVLIPLETPTPPLKEQYGPFSKFQEETSICMRRHSEIFK